MGYASTAIKSKWIKTKWLLTDAAVKKYVPETALFSKSRLKDMLSHYSTVYFKPTDGSGGFNIVRIKKLSKGYETQHNAVKTNHGTLDSLYRHLKKRTKKRSYLLQRGIKLAKAKGRPFDIRVMVQKSDKGNWCSTAILTKVGMANKVATNYHQGGRLGYFSETLSKAGFHASKIKRKQAELKKLGVSVGKLFDGRKKGFRELGLDVAIDSEGRAWILEVNTRPQIYPIRGMSDKNMYRRILSYAKQYGRNK